MRTMIDVVCDADKKTIRLTPDRRIFTLENLIYSYQLNKDKQDKKAESP